MGNIVTPRKDSEARQAQQYLAQSQIVPPKSQAGQNEQETTDVDLENLSRDYSPNAKLPESGQFTWLHAGLCILAVAAFCFLCVLLYAEDKVQVWAVAGDTVRNLSGFIVVAGAWIAWETNKSRSNEAEKSDFRDRMRWAIENSDHENQLVSEYASAVIRSFAGKSNSAWMSNEDKFFVGKAVAQSQTITEHRGERERLLRVNIDEAVNDLQKVIEESSRELSDQSKRALREAETKRLAHEYEHPYESAEVFIKDIHKIIDTHLKEDK